MYIEIKTERLICRPLSTNDLMTAHEYASDFDNTKYMIYLPNETIEETKAFLSAAEAEWELEEPAYYEFAVIYGDAHIGAVSLYMNDAREEAEFGWIINKHYHKQGFAFEAVKAIKDFAEDQLGVKRFVAQCDARNFDSARLMEKLGLRLISDDGERIYPRTGESARELTYASF